MRLLFALGLGIGFVAVQAPAFAQNEPTIADNYCGINRTGWRSGSQITSGRFKPLMLRVKRLRRQQRGKKSRLRRNVSQVKFRELRQREIAQTARCVGSPSADFPVEGFAPAPAGTFFPWQLFPLSTSTGQEIVPFFVQAENISVKLTDSSYDADNEEVTFWFELINTGKPTSSLVLRYASSMVDISGQFERASVVVLPGNKVSSAPSVQFIPPYSGPELERPFRFGLRFRGTPFQPSTTLLKLTLHVPDEFSGTVEFFNVPFDFNSEGDGSGSGVVTGSGTTFTPND